MAWEWLIATAEPHSAAKASRFHSASLDFERDASDSAKLIAVTSKPKHGIIDRTARSENVGPRREMHHIISDQKQLVRLTRVIAPSIPSTYLPYDDG